MDYFDQIFTLLADQEGISLNSNFLETGVLNIVALVAILVSTGKDFLGSILEERQVTIRKEVKDAEDRLQQAQRRLQETQQQLRQANLVMRGIQEETVATKKLLLTANLAEAKQELKVRFDRALATFQSNERQVLMTIKQQISSLVFQRTLTRVQETFRSPERATAFLTETIEKLEGDFL